MKVGQKFNVVEVKDSIYSEHAFKIGGWTIQRPPVISKKGGVTLPNGSNAYLYKKGLFLEKTEVKLVGQLIVKILK